MTSSHPNVGGRPVGRHVDATDGDPLEVLSGLLEEGVEIDLSERWSSGVASGEDRG
jgi:hypothetical protein